MVTTSTAPPARRRGHEVGGRLQLTGRDQQLLRWLAGYPYATADQILRRLSAPRAYLMRLPRLERAGALASTRLAITGHKAYRATQLAADLVGADLTPPRAFDLRTSRHDLALTDLATTHELAGDQVWSERQIRATHALGDHSLTIPIHGHQGGARWHYPDLLTQHPDGGLVAVELELAPKRRRRLRGLLDAYRDAAHIDRVLYLAERPALQHRLAGLVADMALQDKVQVQAWQPFDWTGWRPVAGEQRPGSHTAGAGERRRGGQQQPELATQLLDEVLADVTDDP